ncbi:Membrane-anchored junction protein [Dissostichus eleginoides]|uniref:Membrane-anchored junction protein n=1 Tax=Dissostichus eleginoides TaxID=100907 RepID=A0AAD9F741_DISEL|nr:Membrane-anchored junction protein [Dissostichus eleginoides]
MPLQAFSSTLAETRFFRAGSFIYKFKIRGGCSFSAHFNIFPYKKRWEGARQVVPKHGDRKLAAYPYCLTLYLEKNMQHEEAKQAEEKLSSEKDAAVSEPRSKRCTRCSPLEEAILKDLNQDFETKSKASAVGRLSLDRPHTLRDAKEDAGCFDEKDAPQQKQGVTVKGSGTPGEVHSGTIEPMEEDEEEDEESDPGTPERPGILSRLASYVFPFSLLFGDP